MNRSVPFCLLLALSAGAHAQAPPRELLAGIDVNIAADGSVLDYRLADPLDKDIAAALKRQVMGWHFAPAQGNGHAVRAKTHLLVSLQPADASAGWNRWTVTDVSIGEPMLARRALLMPDYPLAALRAHLGARVVVMLQLAANGKVQAVHAEQTSLTSPGDGKLAGQWREIFEDVALRAAKGWKFRPVESIDDQAVGTTLRIPIVFVYDVDRAHRYYPGPIVPAPWLKDEPADSAAERDTLGNGQIQAVEGRVHLADVVIGRIL